MCMSKVRVLVLRGGPSEEYDVSLRTGESVLQALDTTLYEPIDVVITRGGEWLHNGRVRDAHVVIHSSDVVFNALHGSYGEDGQVQRLLEREGVPFTGSRSYPSAIAMNKAITKDKLRECGVLFARHMVVGRSALHAREAMAHSIVELFGPKCIVKPVNGGSSIGTERANNEHELALVLSRILSIYEQVLVEEFIEGREATCGVIENFREEAIYALPTIEIVPPAHAGFFSSGVKYTGESEEICPSRFSRSEKDHIEQAAKRVHETLELSQYSRSDFIVSPHGVYFLEVNTLPGMTAESLFPKALQAVGVKYSDFIEHVLTLALSRSR